MDDNGKDVSGHMDIPTDVDEDGCKSTPPDAVQASQGLNCDVELLTLGLSPEGALVTKSQVDDYVFRGDELEDMSLLEFISDTYEEQVSHKKGPISEQGDKVRNDVARHAGRPTNMRVKYHTQHPWHASRIRVVRPKNHRTIANIVGKWLPRSDDADEADVHRASILCLLKPWRKMSSLKMSEETWKDSYDSFLRAAGNDKVAMIGNAQFYYDCKDAAERSRTQDTVVNDSIDAGDESDDGHEKDESSQGFDHDLSEANLEAFVSKQEPTREIIHGLQAVEHAKAAHVFGSWVEAWGIEPGHSGIGIYNDERQAVWKSAIKNERGGCAEPGGSPMGAVGTVEVVSGTAEPAISQGSVESLGGSTQVATQQADSALQLGVDQIRAYDLISVHVLNTIRGIHQDQLSMLLLGEGGTGKSVVIQAITRLFEANNSSGMLAKGAYTGIAACHIGGRTLHTLAGIPLGKKMPTMQQIADLAKEWQMRRYLIIDECSMISRS
ncbi:uncharacterized protein EI90DRAFT_1746181, partial [Cantharellus anzutake]|uniref:uncharacterized protein n=1 Tax=Cantharellus anzutake TaxID=1750568 RepID=UPI0019061D28